MNIILIPGFWLDASSWDPVVPAIRAAGHVVQSLTLPGMEDGAENASAVTLADHVDAVVRALDSLAPEDGRVVLVGHSAGGPVAHAAVDARPDRVARVIYIDSVPLAHGDAVNPDLPVVDGVIPLPDWEVLGDDMLRDLDGDLRDSFRAQAVPTPARVASDPQVLSDEGRYDVPVTVISCEMPAATYQDLLDPDHEWHAYVAELSRVRDVSFIDLPTGHWPQITRPDDLAAAIVDAVDVGDARPDPPLAGDEAETLLGFLDYQRATLAWKCGGVDADGLRSTVAASTMTLGGLLKHMALVEDHWFSRRLHGNDPAEPWGDVDWNADRDWEWTSAADDSPGDLFDLWRGAVERSRRLTAAALADGGLGTLAVRAWPDGRSPSLRWILVHMVEEYARHNGHADLLREAVDGETGE